MTGVLSRLFVLLSQKPSSVCEALEEAFSGFRLSPDEADDNGVTLLLYAMRKLNLQAAEILLNEGANPFIVSKYGQCAAGLISKFGNESLRKMLLEWGDLTESPMGSAEAWPVVQGICRAAALGDCKKIQSALQAGEPPDQRDAWGHSALLIAVVHGQEGAAKLLLEAGADPNALQTLVEFNVLSFVEALQGLQDTLLNHSVEAAFGLLNSVLIDARDNSQSITPVHLASIESIHHLAAKGDVSRIKHLLELGVSPQLKDSYGQTAIQIAEQVHADSVIEQFQDWLTSNGNRISNFEIEEETLEDLGLSEQDESALMNELGEESDFAERIESTDFLNAISDSYPEFEANFPKNLLEPKIGKLKDDVFDLFSDEQQEFRNSSEDKPLANTPVTKEVPPSAASLTEALRGLGYSLGDAVADIIDNAIAAKARQVWVDYAKGEKRGKWFLIRDDGVGMNEAEMVNALKLGSKSPKVFREKTDLGRFGLGLKTASFSQCRRLAVCSIKNGQAVAYAWDLDILALKDEWVLEKIDSPLSDERFAQLKNQTSGTVVLWEKIDRAFGCSDALSKEFQSNYLESLERLEKHLRLTFHQFLAVDPLTGEAELAIYFGSAKRKIVPWDPFFSSSFAAPYSYQKEFWPEESQKPLVEIHPYVLPNPESTRTPITLYGKEDLLDMQGFFIYRGKRLICCSGWLGLGIHKSPIYALARIKLTFDNQHDLDWQLDIRKSKVKIPRKKGWNRLRQLLCYRANSVAEQSAEILQASLEKSDHGLNTGVQKSVSLWRKDRGASPQIDFASKIGMALRDALLRATKSEEVQGLLEILAFSHPTQEQRARFAEVSPLARAAIVELVYELAEGKAENVPEALSMLADVEPFASWPAIMNEFKEDEE